MRFVGSIGLRSFLVRPAFRIPLVPENYLEDPLKMFLEIGVFDSFPGHFAPFLVRFEHTCI
jgi:hypothetical protein